MRSTTQLSITLPNEMASHLRAKVASGDYASESEVIRDGLRALQARDRAVDAWLVAQVVPAYGAIVLDPSRSRAPDDVRASLAAEHARTIKAR